MGVVFHQRFHVIVNEELRNKIADYKGKEPKNVTEQDVNDYINEALIPVPDPEE